MNNIKLFYIYIDERVARDNSVFPVNGLCYIGVIKSIFEEEGRR